MTQIGRLNQRVRIEKSVLTPDGHGGNVQSWALRAVVYACVEPLSSREALMASQLTGVLQTALTIWWAKDPTRPSEPNISVKDRILLGKRILNVVSYQDLTGEHDELRVLCSEVQA